MGLLLSCFVVSVVSAQPIHPLPLGMRRLTRADLNQDARPDDYQVVTEAGPKLVAVVTLSNGQCFRFPLELPSVGAIVPFDNDHDGDLDLIFFDAHATLTQTAWNESSHGFRTSPVQRPNYPGERPQVASGSGVDAISLTSPPLVDQEYTGVHAASTLANPINGACQSLSYSSSHSPHCFLLYSLTRRGPPALSSIF